MWPRADLSAPVPWHGVHAAPAPSQHAGARGTSRQCSCRVTVDLTLAAAHRLLERQRQRRVQIGAALAAPPVARLAR